MTFSAGTKLGTYEILGPLGKGGMGEVYRARDANLKREVDGDRKPFPVVQTNFNERLAQFSPDGKWITVILNWRPKS